MVAGILQPTYFGVPALLDLPGELLDIAEIHEGIDFLETGGLFESYSCLSTDVVPVMPCPAVFMAPPVQSASATATTGGTLAAGTYRAVITAINARGETLKSNEISQVTTGATSTITWNWVAVTGATGYRIYVTAVNGATATETFLIQVGAVLTYTWTGTPARSAGVPPTTSTAVVAATKTFEAPSWQDGFRFAVYAGMLCKSFTADDDTEVTKVFLTNESVGVERAVMLQRFVANGSLWGAPTDLTPAGGAVTPTQGLALLEGHASWNYAGAPTIHAPRSVGSLLGQNNQIVRKGDAFYTFQGSPLASGGGYEQPNQGPTGAAPATGEKWVYASGGVSIARGELFSHTELNRDTNELVTLVERMYVAAVDCYTSAVRVKLY